MEKRKKCLSKLAVKGMALVNSLALLLVIQNVNMACAWMWGQPEVPDTLKKKYRKF